METSKRQRGVRGNEGIRGYLWGCGIVRSHGLPITVELQFVERRETLEQLRELQPWSRAANGQLFSVLGDPTAWLGCVFDQALDVRGAGIDPRIQRWRTDCKPSKADSRERRERLQIVLLTEDPMSHANTNRQY